MNRSTACHNVNEIGYQITGPKMATADTMMTTGTVGISGNVTSTATKIATRTERKVKMTLAVVAPNSNASSPRRYG